MSDETGAAFRPHEALAALRARMEAGYTLATDREQLASDMRELLEFARSAADLLAQVAGWVAEYDEGEVDDAMALYEIRELVDGWGI